MRIKNENGFTLIEIITVLGIIGILAAIATPSFLSWLPNMRLKAAARDLYSDMQKAKMEAVKSNRAITFNFTVSRPGPPCQGGGYSFPNSAGVIVVNRAMSNNICLSTSSRFPAGVGVTGLPAGATGAIRLTYANATRAYTVTQTIAGGIRLQ